MTDFNLVDANGVVTVRSFANKGLATRYANKHGLTVAKSLGAIALIETVETETDVDTVLESLETESSEETEVKTLREIALSFDQNAVDVMTTALVESFERRDAFEHSQGLSLFADNSYTKERKRMLDNKVAVARFFLALDVQPSAVIERKVAENAMFNAKALKKVTELARFTVGFGERLERVMRAFIACALVATDKGVSVMTNSVNVRFLNATDLATRITDTDLLDNLEMLRHRAMTSGAETQSSQARNVLDVLGLGAIKSVDKSRDAIVIDADHAFYALFRERFMTA